MLLLWSSTPTFVIICCRCCRHVYMEKDWIMQIPVFYYIPIYFLLLFRSQQKYLQVFMDY